MLVYSDNVNFLADSRIGSSKTKFLLLAEKMVPINLRSPFLQSPGKYSFLKCSVGFRLDLSCDFIFFFSIYIH
jgi:hypothetical protein